MPELMTDTDWGIIYVLSDSSGKLSKVGRTRSGTAVGRATSYGKAHGHKWKVDSQFPTLRVAEVEANIHAHLHLRRVQTDTRAKEIFRMSSREVVSIVFDFLIPPDSLDETYRASIRNHTQRVRSRIRDQIEYLRRRSRQSFVTEETIRYDIYPQLIALDALDREISISQMLSIYARMHEIRTLEVARLKAENEARFEAAWARKSFFSKIFGDIPHIKEEIIDDVRFPVVPYYAVNLLNTKWAKAQSDNSDVLIRPVGV